MGMRSGGRGGLLLALALALVVTLCMSTEARQLQERFYEKRCPAAELIVREEVHKAVMRDPSMAAGLLRLHFHDCFVRGCDASVLLDTTSRRNKAEKHAPPNRSLRGFEVIGNAKERLEAVCEGVVSCADVLAFAARDSVFMSGGPIYQVPAGRRDGRVSLASEALHNLPSRSSNLDQLTQVFATKGLTQTDMITLSGAHTIGAAHCAAFSERLHPSNSTTAAAAAASHDDPTLDPEYAARLKHQCRNGRRRNVNAVVVPMDPRSPNLFDTSYYSNIMANRGLLKSDQALMSTPASAAQVRQNAANLPLFHSKFGAAMVKMGQIGVLTGRNGEIRTDCHVIN